MGFGGGRIIGALLRRAARQKDNKSEGRHKATEITIKHASVLAPR
jgi:hypothetical protein